MKTRGFTLLELLIVIAIIGVLVGIGLPALVAAKRASKEKACKADVVQISSALDSYTSKHGDYPPTGGWLKGINDVNVGNEGLVWHLFINKSGGPYLDMASWEGKLENKDADDGGKKNPDSVYQKTELPELVDEFHNPYIYFHHRDYAKPDKYSKYTIAGQEQICKPGKSDKTGNYHAPGKFQVWSAGSDDTNNDGGEGDIASWNN